MQLKQIKQFLMGRLFVVTFSIFLQLAFLVGVLYYLSDSVVEVLFLLQFISLAVVVWLVSKDDNPSYKIPWVVCILVFPVMGGLFYLLWGNKRIPRKLRRQISGFYHSHLQSLAVDSGLEGELHEFDPNIGAQAQFIKRTTGFPAWANTQARFFPLGEDTFPVMLEELKKARSFILMEYFIIREGKMWNAILEVLKEKVRQGVQVLLMYDDIGCIQTLPPGYDRYLRSLGIDVTVFNPYHAHLNLSMNYRDHRKILVIDGNVGFCGGINLADEYINARPRFGHWKDTAVMIRGHAVWNLSLMFLTLWGFSNEGRRVDFARYCPTVSLPSDGYVQPFGDSPLDNVNVTENTYLHMINRAVERVYLTTPYLVLDNEMLTALKMAALSGVDVRIVTPHIPDKWYVHMVSRSYYKTLIESGVRIFEYTPGFIHAKQYVVDDKVAVVGTANMDFRSFYLHFECGIAFYGSSVVEKVTQDIMNTLQYCQEITLKEVGDIPLWRRLLASCLKIYAPLM